MKCSKCGYENTEDAAFCTLCYEVLKKAAKGPSTAPPVRPQLPPEPKVPSGPFPWGLLFVPLLLAGGYFVLPQLKRKPLSEASLKTLSGETVNVSPCPTEKCMMIYVAPWCHYCHEAIPTIVALRDFLEGRNITTRVVVGMASAKEIEAFAGKFGPGTLLDVRHVFSISSVPHFLVLDRSGRIIKEGGLGPMNQSEINNFANYYGLL
ncbi:MAG: hypothetical protein Q7R35_10080 [Elusimicrobiota bacterium]|nr:hypothetical protein [Elusimicrobiota bacterium]